MRLLGLAAAAVLGAATSCSSSGQGNPDQGNPDQGSAACTVNADCMAQGTYFICRKDTHACVNLQAAPLCTTVIGNYQDDNALLIGEIFPLSGPNQATGIALQDSTRLAVSDFTGANGLPPAPGQTARRPLAVVSCDDQANSNTAVMAAKHLVNDVGVPAIIGPAFSAITTSVATTVTIPARVMLMSPSATSDAITNLDTSSPRLVWRTSPPDSFQATALALYTSDPTQGLEAKVRMTLGLKPTDKIKIMILHKGDVYGNALAAALGSQLMINGAPASGQAGYQDLDYGNPADPGSDPLNYATQVQATLTQAPHIVFLLGTSEAIQSVFEPIEEQWTNTAYRPLYVFSDGGEVSDLPAYVASRETKVPTPAGASTLRGRISGSVFGASGPLHQAFVNSYKAAFQDGSDPTTFGAAGAYDSIYLLSYAATSLTAAGVKSAAVTGPNLASGMAQLVPPGTSLNVGGGNIAMAFSQLTAGQKIDFNGASGPLNFDLVHGQSPSNVQIWCIAKDAATGLAGAEINSTLYYDATQSKLSGTYSGCN